MHVETKRIALTGLLTAVTVLLVSLGAVFETNTLYLIAVASFCVGIVIREWGMIRGAMFWFASVILCMMIAPNKMYGITFAAMGLYLLFSEWLWERVASAKNVKHRMLIVWIGRYVFFNCMYVPMVLFFPKLLLSKSVSGALFWGVVLAGEIMFFVYEIAYSYFQKYVWEKFRHKLIG